MSELEASYRLACRIARRTARNFYFSFLTLPRDLRRDMCALYAYMRHTDDLGDDESLPLERRRERLQAWELRMRDALSSRSSSDDRCDNDTSIPGTAILPALIDVVRRHKIPEQSLFDVIEGVRSDLQPRRFQTFAELEQYCHLVAGAVGVCCIHIWGFDRTEPQAVRQAIDTGTAFQLTNILRDLGEDLDRGRLYLPIEDLDRFQLKEDELRSTAGSDAFRRMMAFQTHRAREFYYRGWELAPALDSHGRKILSAMFQIYGGLLTHIEAGGFDLFNKRIGLSLPRKLFIAATCLWPWSRR